ncbi:MULTISPECIES: tryptophanase leader peptide [Zooshikella]
MNQYNNSSIWYIHDYKIAFFFPCK